MEVAPEGEYNHGGSTRERNRTGIGSSTRRNRAGIGSSTSGRNIHTEAAQVEGIEQAGGYTRGRIEQVWVATPERGR
jgi:hypothetical protein